MDPESTLEELNTACVVALRCLVFVGIIGAEIESRIRRGEVGAAHLAEAIRESTSELLENLRALDAALKPHVLHDFMAASDAPVEIGDVAAESAHAAAFSVAHLALVSLATALKPAEFWASLDSETYRKLPDFDLEAVVEEPEGAAVLALGTIFDPLSMREISKGTAVVYREFAAARARLRAAGGDVTPLATNGPNQAPPTIPPAGHPGPSTDKAAQLRKIEAKVRQVAGACNEKGYWKGCIAIGPLFKEAYEAGAWQREGSQIGDRLKRVRTDSQELWTDGQSPAWTLDAYFAVVEPLTSHLMPPSGEKEHLELEAGIAADEIEEEAKRIEAGDGTRAGGKVEPKATPYPTPNTYARDKWIYDNVTKFTCDTLSLELKKRAKIEKWSVITSRNGFKKAADRYAAFHDKPLRRFRGE